VAPTKDDGEDSMPGWSDAMIADMRAHGGKVTQGRLAGYPHLIITTKGARTGEWHTTVLAYSRDGSQYVIAATAGGAPKNPAWYHNIVANPQVTVEVDGGVHQAKAAPTAGAERDRLWANHVATLPYFADYPEKTGRVIPVIALDLID
jgi:deazaflavin-dependent oxidoreductase (nitroreductase family)